MFPSLSIACSSTRTFLVDVASDRDAETHLRVALQLDVDGVVFPLHPILAAEGRERLKFAYIFLEILMLS